MLQWRMLCWAVSLDTHCTFCSVLSFADDLWMVNVKKVITFGLPIQAKEPLNKVENKIQQGTRCRYRQAFVAD